MGHSRGAFNLCEFNEGFGNVVQCFVSPLLMEHLSPPEENSELDLVSFFEELPGMIELEIKVMLINLEAEPDFFQTGGMMLALLFALAHFPLLLIEPFAVIHDSADWRSACR